MRETRVSESRTRAAVSSASLAWIDRIRNERCTDWRSSRAAGRASAGRGVPLCSLSRRRLSVCAALSAVTTAALERRSARGESSYRAAWGPQPPRASRRRDEPQRGGDGRDSHRPEHQFRARNPLGSLNVCSADARLSVRKTSLTDSALWRAPRCILLQASSQERREYRRNVRSLLMDGRRRLSELCGELGLRRRRSKWRLSREQL